MSLIKINKILIRLVEDFGGRDDSKKINLLEMLSQYTPVDKTSSWLPNVPLTFDKDTIFDFILRALAKQFEKDGIEYFVIERLFELDQKICGGGGDPPADNDRIPLPYKLVLQLLVHWSKIASDDTYNASKQLEKDMEEICREMLLPLNQLPEFVLTADSTRDRIVKFLTRPAVVDLFCGELEKYNFPDLSAENVKRLVKEEMRIYECARKIWSLYGWTVMDGIVLVTGSLPPPELPNRWANVYTLSLHESVHFLARRFSKNFGFSSPGKDQQFKDPDAVLAAKGRGLELGRSLELALLGVQVNWHKTPPDVAKEFVAQVENDHHSGPYLADDENRQKLVRGCLCSYSGMMIDLDSYYRSPQF